MGYRWNRTGVWLVAAAAILGHELSAKAEDRGQEIAAKNGEVVFPLQEISVLKAPLERSLQSDLTRGARAECQEAPHEAVKAYPKVGRKNNLYSSSHCLRASSASHEANGCATAYLLAVPPPERES